MAALGLSLPGGLPGTVGLGELAGAIGLAVSLLALGIAMGVSGVGRRRRPVAGPGWQHSLSWDDPGTAAHPAPAGPEPAGQSAPGAPVSPPEPETAPLPVILGPRTGPPAPPPPAVASLEQLKELYLTAEAVGDDVLARHFDELSGRQRELIRRYFEQLGLGGKTGPANR